MDFMPAGVFISGVGDAMMVVLSGEFAISSISQWQPEHT